MHTRHSQRHSVGKQGSSGHCETAGRLADANIQQVLCSTSKQQSTRGSTSAYVSRGRVLPAKPGGAACITIAVGAIFFAVESCIVDLSGPAAYNGVVYAAAVSRRHKAGQAAFLLAVLVAAHPVAAGHSHSTVQQSC